MKNFRKIVRAMIYRIYEREGFVLPFKFRTRLGLWDIDAMQKLAREYTKNAGSSIDKDTSRYDPVIAERIDIIANFWRFVASAVSCDNEKGLTVVRKKYIEFLHDNPLDNRRRYR